MALLKRAISFMLLSVATGMRHEAMVEELDVDDPPGTVKILPKSKYPRIPDIEGIKFSRGGGFKLPRGTCDATRYTEIAQCGGWSITDKKKDKNCHNPWGWDICKGTTIETCSSYFGLVYDEDLDQPKGDYPTTDGKYVQCRPYEYWDPNINETVPVCAARGWYFDKLEVFLDWHFPAQVCSIEQEPLKSFLEGQAELKMEKCKNTLCEMAKSGSWHGADMESMKTGKSSPWPQRTLSLKTWGWLKAAKEDCTDFEGTTAGFNMLPKQRLKEAVTQGDMWNNFNKTLCGCSTEDDCS
mmetsp:Transcript_6557/g.11394  ORF Transcript_6557/g.11394 Transcript_6557/m.11394 type:complete len:297 (+) Transcript_6557:94-984(+)